MPVSPSSSEHRPIPSAASGGGRSNCPRRRGPALALGAALIALAAGCVTVRPEDREYLAEPSMTWTNDSMAARHEAHVIDNREGSTGGAETKAGGCGCN